GRVHYAAALLLNAGGHDRAVGGQGADGGFFILAHQAAVALDIGAENGRELAFHTGLRSHRLKLTMSVNMIAASCRFSACALLLVSSFIGTDYSADVVSLSTSSRAGEVFRL